MSLTPAPSIPPVRTSPSRIRITLLPPFAEHKYLLPLPDHLQTVSELKKYLVSSLTGVSALAKSGKELLLEVDGFEVLGGCGLDVVREEDVVAVRLAPGSSTSLRIHTNGQVNHGIVLDRKPVTAKASKKRKRLSLGSEETGDSANGVSRSGTAPPIGLDASRKRGKTDMSSTPRPDTPNGTKRQSMGRRSLASNGGGTDPVASRTTAESLGIKNTAPKRPSRLGALVRSRSRSSSGSSSSSTSDGSSTSVSSSTASSSSSSSSASSSRSSSSGSSSADHSVLPERVKIAKAGRGAEAASAEYSVLLRNVASDTLHTVPLRGKPSTQDRNARRRKARAIRKAEERASTTTSNAAPASASASAVVQLSEAEARPAQRFSRSTANHKQGPGDLGQSHDHTVPPEAIVVPSSGVPVPRCMVNRNKKKGFMKEMAGLKATKIVFDTPQELGQVQEREGSGVGQAAQTATAADEPVPHQVETNFTPNATPLRSGKSDVRPATWHPSSVPEDGLPVNLFVSSVQHTFNRRRGQQNGRHSLPAGKQGESNGGAETEPHHALAVPLKAAVQPNGGPVAPNVLLEESTLETETPEQAPPDALWKEAETTYNQLRPLEVSVAKEGTTLCWPQVELNMSTFSPELVYKIGTIVKVDEEGVILKPIPRPLPPVEWDSSAGDQYVGESAAQEEEGEEIRLTKAEVAAETGKWRVLRP